MALVRIKDIQRQGWKDVWARYYQQRSFPTPGNYLRRSMLVALATHFATADMKVLESWIQEYGFDSPLKLTEAETQEAARRVHLAVEEAINRAEEDRNMEDEDENEDEGEEENEEDE
ncbi:hypothetical protein B0H63DRAFT_268510 [Podospora didyma]|uniref:Uncharacterized protein n=1 Tax=Podospora didyma TaxID=330526 RepID=A0AAE0KFA7_9PEZI|nr:hypothetical protein B0H63DRAFT_268510 [Podospora didyma]